MGEFLFKASISIPTKPVQRSGLTVCSYFQLKLTNIDAVSLLDKRGYLTICISQKTEGRVYLRLQEGIRDWFYHIQSTVYESKKRRKFWVKGPTYPSHTNNRLARLYGENKPVFARTILAIRIFIIFECISIFKT